ncbi:glycosyltransferase family 2 protein [Caballeronia sp. BR00000012568055]|uniref:glycosyltransferase family 2 protein n=1 Tax=Caballeronia sp. BR00000012568055 TaxID=2918761 RepID=UPI0023F8EA15|nr:glycosyltransferase family 2 protein [Caballeronia sp. BR00000012568055]
MLSFNVQQLIEVDTVFEEIRTESPSDEAVTVAVSLFNYERFIIDCLASISAQTHEHLELIVVDDCSKNDHSVELAEQWLRENHARFGRVLLLRHKRNQGLAAARNTAFRHSRTDPVFVIDADNQIYPRAIARLHEFVRYRDFDAAYTQLEFFGNEQRLGHADLWDGQRFRSGNYVDAMALISRRSWAQAGGYTHMEGGWEDYEFWCKFVNAGMKAAYIPEILCRYRVHGASMLRTETVVAQERLKIELTMKYPDLAII